MPRVDISDENRQTSVFDYPRLRLEKKDERGRIWLAETSPQFEFIHNLRAAKIVDGKPVYEKVKNKAGEEVDVMAFDFLGRPICLGDYSTVKEKAADPDNCEACKRSLESDAVPGAERRFAGHVWRYNCKMGSSDIAEPFGGQLQAWVFGGNIFNKLIDLKNEWGDLSHKDLTLGPCTVVKFQKFEIAIAATCQVRASQDRAAIVATAFKENRCPDLSRLIGDRVDATTMHDMLERVLSRYKMAHGMTASPGDTPTKTEVQASLDDIINQTMGSTETPQEDAPQVTISDPLAALIQDEADAPRREELTAAAVEATAAPEPQPAPAGETISFDSFDDLFK